MTEQWIYFDSGLIRCAVKFKIIFWFCLKIMNLWVPFLWGFVKVNPHFHVNFTNKLTKRYNEVTCCFVPRSLDLRPNLPKVTFLRNFKIIRLQSSEQRGRIIWLPSFNLMAEIKTVACRINRLSWSDGLLFCSAVKLFNVLVPTGRARGSLPPEALQRFIFYYFHNSHFTITTGKAFRTVSLWNHSRVSLPQGPLVGPILFILYVLWSTLSNALVARGVGMARIVI